MAIKNYMINDKWLDIAKQNTVEVESTDGVIGSVKVNGEEYGGGGGSSDFSTAEVTIINNSSSELNTKTFVVVYPEDEEITSGFNIDPDSEATFEVVLYKGKQNLYSLFKGATPIADGTGIAVTGDIENLSDEYEVYIVITGDGTITIS